MGIIFAPAKNRLFYSFGKNFSYEYSDGKEKKIHCEKKNPKDIIKAVAYSNNLKPEISKIHKKFGGIVPELAARSHIDKIDLIVNAALKKSGRKLKAPANVKLHVK